MTDEAVARILTKLEQFTPGVIEEMLRWAVASNMIIAAVALSVVVGWTIVLRRIAKAEGTWNLLEWNTWDGAPFVFSILVYPAGLTIFLCSSYNAAMAAFAPDLYVVKTLLG